MRDWKDAGHKFALATVVETWGSSPRPVGSHLILRDDGMMEGSVSGGCVEGAVIAALEELMDGGVPRILDFSVSSEQAWQVGLSCGGRIRVLVEGMNAKANLIEDVLSAKTEQRVETDVNNGETDLNPSVTASSKSELVEVDGNLSFVHILTQPLELVIIGAVHVSQAMVKMAEVLNVNSTVIDPRRAFAQSERFPDHTLVDDWPDDALSRMDITSGTAIVTLTHDSKLDDAALEVALKSPAFYIASGIPFVIIGMAFFYQSEEAELESNGGSSSAV